MVKVYLLSKQHQSFQVAGVFLLICQVFNFSWRVDNRLGSFINKNVIFSVHGAKHFKHLWVILDDTFLSDGKLTNFIKFKFIFLHASRPNIGVDDTGTAKSGKVSERPLTTHVK